ncbi:hypothetical protein [Palleronia caenipelagi]|uniref:hypothetical protein n=1 Tax=Palleronia caenipelagi TaxID=2489174 RepID=UPI00115EC146|nr:hypothetical protein [Palleronia caenipelagi]
MADIQEQHKSVAKAVLGIISLSVIFFPSIFAAIRRPYTLDWAMYTYWICAFSSFVILLFAYYKSAFSNVVPIRAIGIGNLSAALSILSLFLFVIGNILSDQLSKPRVIEISLSNHLIEYDTYLEATGTAYDDDGDDLIWNWSIRPSTEAHANGASLIQLKSQSRSIVWWLGANMVPGVYFIEVTVSDGSRESDLLQREFRVKD